MALDADTLLDRMQLKQQLLRWRSISILLLTLIGLLLVNRSFDVREISSSDYIARVTIEGIIAEDRPRQRMLEEVEENDNIKAVLVHLDTPGGTAIGGEELYIHLKRLAEKKPVVILMRTLCTSAGYMAALGGDVIFAREGTITGSIGVIMQTMEFTEMAKSIGVEPIIFRSGPNKAAPNPLEKIKPAQEKVIEGVVADFYAFFLGLVKKERDIAEEKLKTLADGRIFTGRQALEEGLIDALGGELEAKDWLKKNHQIATDTKVKDVKPKREKDDLLSKLNQVADTAINKAENLPLGLDGLVLIWHPSLTK